MDLLSSIRKSGSRGGVDFKWSDVASSSHRENYLGHSLMAPVGRWQKGRDLNWYAKADGANRENETDEQRAARERKEEIQKIKEAEEDALARALGLPVQPRGDGQGTGANGISVGEVSRVVKEVEGEGEEGVVEEEMGKFGDFVGKAGEGEVDRREAGDGDAQVGGLLGQKPRSRRDRDDRDPKSKRDRDGRRRSRSRSRERRRRHHRRDSRSPERRHRHASRSPGRHGSRAHDDKRDPRKHRPRDDDRRDRKHRSRGRSRDRYRPKREDGDRSRSRDRYRPKRDDRDRSRSRDRKPRRSASPGYGRRDSKDEKEDRRR